MAEAFGQKRDSGKVSPQISVLLPVYNGGAYLEDAVESVLAQSLSDFELIIVDDLSSDGSREKLEKLQAKDKRIRLELHDVNCGLFANYNRCLALAKCELIKPFAQDDLLAKDALEKMSQALNEDQTIALVSSARNIINGKGEVKEVVRTFDVSRRIKGKDVILYNLIALTNWIGEPSTVMFRRRHAGTGFDTKYFHFGDLDMWFRVLLNGDYYFIDAPLAAFRRHDRSATSNNLNGLLFAVDVLNLVKQYEDVLTEFGEPKEHCLRRVAEYSALQLDHLVRNQDLTVEKSVAAALKGARVGASDEQLVQRVLEGYVELSFNSLRCLTHTLSDLSDVKCRAQSDTEYLNNKLNNMSNSTSWKLTAPIRRLLSSD